MNEMRTKAKFAKINFFQNSRNCLKIYNIYKEFIQEKRGWIMVRTARWDILTCASPVSFS